MKRFCMLLAAGILAVSFVFGSSVAWEGRAAVGSADIFPAGGNYAQSRVFSKGEIVEVYNTLNGKKINVVITDTTELTGVLILLSPEAAEELEVSAAYDTVVRISRKNDYVAESTPEGGSIASVPDPDTNAAEALKDDYVLTEETAEEAVDASTEVAEAAETEPEAASSVSAYEYASLPEIATQQPSVTVIPTQPAQTSPVQTAPAQNTQPVQTAPAQTSAVANTQPQVQSNAVLVPQDQYKQNVPYPELQITEYEKNKYYVQLSVNRDVANIRNIVSKYRGKYPVSLKQSSRYTDAYEVLIGPLNADEYNAILNKVKKDGYKDAFVKRGY